MTSLPTRLLLDSKNYTHQLNLSVNFETVSFTKKSEIHAVALKLNIDHPDGILNPVVRLNENIKINPANDDLYNLDNILIKNGNIFNLRSEKIDHHIDPNIARLSARMDYT